jgi:alkanesulfonate monooxygenase SsuD/methylene tetrahydromethanopterin reductase-like flavin-dependent oxidoreductase (luciferase family)
VEPRPDRPLPGPPVEFLVEKFEEYAREAGLDSDDVDRSWLGHILVAPDDETLRGYCERIFPLEWGGSVGTEYLADADEAREKGDFFLGTPAEVAEQLDTVRDLGFDRVQLFFLDYPGGDGMELFGDEVVPEF